MSAPSSRSCRITLNSGRKNASTASSENPRARTYASAVTPSSSCSSRASAGRAITSAASAASRARSPFAMPLKRRASTRPVPIRSNEPSRWTKTVRRDRPQVALGDAERLDQRPRPRVGREDDLEAAVHRPAAVPDRPRPPAGGLLGLEHVHRAPRGDQRVRAGQARQAAPHDHAVEPLGAAVRSRRHPEAIVPTPSGAGVAASRPVQSSTAQLDERPRGGRERAVAVPRQGDPPRRQLLLGRQQHDLVVVGLDGQRRHQRRGHPGAHQPLHGAVVVGCGRRR